MKKLLVAARLASQSAQQWEVAVSDGESDAQLVLELALRSVEQTLTLEEVLA